MASAGGLARPGAAWAVTVRTQRANLQDRVVAPHPVAALRQVLTAWGLKEEELVRVHVQLDSGKDWGSRDD